MTLKKGLTAQKRAIQLFGKNQDGWDLLKISSQEFKRCCIPMKRGENFNFTKKPFRGGKFAQITSKIRGARSDKIECHLLAFWHHNDWFMVRGWNYEQMCQYIEGQKQKVSWPQRMSGWPSANHSKILKIILYFQVFLFKKVWS
jgi:hypothetical protein